MTEQLPSLIRPSSALTPLPVGTLIPRLIAEAGEQASWRYVDFFIANIRNLNTRRAYARACGDFLTWCGACGLTLPTIRPYDVASYIELMQQTHAAPTIKQQLAAVRMLFDWLITGQVVPHNPASAVRGPMHVVNTGKTPVLEGDEWRRLLDSIPTEDVRDLRDRALIGTLTYSFARIGAALKMKVEDLRPKGAGRQIRLHVVANSSVGKVDIVTALLRLGIEICPQIVLRSYFPHCGVFNNKAWEGPCDLSNKCRVAQRTAAWHNNLVQHSNVWLIL